MPTWLETLLQAIGGVLGFGVVGWLFKRQVDRLDALDAAVKEKADRDDVDDMLERIFDKLDEHGKESRASIGELHKKLDRALAEQSKINMEVARHLGE